MSTGSQPKLCINIYLNLISLVKSRLMKMGLNIILSHKEPLLH